MPDCNVCGQSFRDSYNLHRHEKKHEEDDEIEMVTDSESVDKSESENESDEEDESANKEETQPDIYDEISNKAWERYISQFEALVEEYTEQGKDDDDAKQAAYKIILPAYRKSFREEYTNMLLKIRELKKDPTYKSVMESAKRLRDDDEHTPEESLRAAITKRKHLVNELVHEQYHDEFPENEWTCTAYVWERQLVLKNQK